MTRAEIIARAESGLGTNYTWGGESWTPDTGSGAGPDCSGYGLKCWEVPKTLLYQEENGSQRHYLPPVYQLLVLQLRRSVVRAEQPLSPPRRGHPGQEQRDVRPRHHLRRWRRLEFPGHLRGTGDRAGDPEDQQVSRQRVQADPRESRSPTASSSTTLPPRASAAPAPGATGHAPRTSPATTGTTISSMPPRRTRCGPGGRRAYPPPVTTRSSFAGPAGPTGPPGSW